MRHDLFATFATSFAEARELYHSKGRLADANQKLDEYVKLLAIHFAASKGVITGEDYRCLLDWRTFKISDLSNAFHAVLSSDLFKTADGTSLFSDSPTLRFDTDEEELTFALFFSLKSIGGLSDEEHTDADFLSTAFGLFVRENFRNHIEDAQYMTPPEVVEFMSNMGLHLTKGANHLTICDPTCGVGSFLTASFIKAKRLGLDTSLVGQDKSYRMTRLTGCNFTLSQVYGAEVYTGNSIYDSSDLNKYAGSCDLILTNPPFGARITKHDLQNEAKISLPYFSNMAPLPESVESEIAFLDRYLELLKPGGVFLAVLPMGLLTAQGLSKKIRDHLMQSGELIAVITLPNTAFAMAGTRTKTCIIVFRKADSAITDYGKLKTFFAEAGSLGFDVATRKGVPKKIKTQQSNSLHEIYTSFVNRKNLSEKTVFHSLSRQTGNWSPNVVFAQALAKGTDNTAPLESYLNDAIARKSVRFFEGSFFISVLHVVSIVQLDFPALLEHKPITPGQPVLPGEIILSRINPRIPRVLVVPNLAHTILCSSEFEVLSPKQGIDPYAVAYALIQPHTWAQVEALAGGTSSSHARIKRGEVRKVRLSQSIFSKRHEDEVLSFKTAVQSSNDSARRLAEIIQLKSGT